MINSTGGKGALSLLITFLFLVFSFSNSLFAEETSPVQEKKILIIHSYHQGLAWTDGQDTGIREILSGVEGMEISEEYLDTKRFALKKISDIYAEFIAQKYGRTKFDAIMATDNNALTFISDHYKILFQDTPVVFSGINDFHPEMLKEFDGMASGVVQVLEPEGTYELIRQLQPGLEKLVVVSGNTPTAQAIKHEVKAALAKYEDSQDIVWLDGLDTKTLLERLANLSGNDAVLLCNFNRDAKGRYYSHAKSGRMISEASKAPVYAMEDHYLGTGVAGGYMNSSRDQGLVAGRICLDILKTGKIPDVVTTSPNVIMFDYKAMNRFGLDVSKLPDSAVIINQPLSFYKQNKRLIWNIVAIFCLLVLGLLSVSFWLIRARKAEAALRLSNSKHQRLVNNLIDTFLYRHDLEGVFNYASSPVTKILGYSTEEFLTYFTNFLTDHPVNAEASEHTRLSINGIQQPPYEVQIYDKDDNIKWLQISESPVFDNAGKVVSVEGVAHDITERKQAEEEIRKSRNFLQEIIDGIPDDIIVIDPDYRIVLANESVRGKIETGMHTGEMKCYQVLNDRINPCGEGGYTCPLRRVIDTRKPATITHTRYDAAGERYVEEISASPIFNDAGEIIYIVEACRDITKRKHAEEALVESEKKYRTLFEQSADAILIIEGDKFIDCNQATVDMLGYSDKKELLNTHPSELSPEFQPDGRKSFEKANEMMAIAVEKGSHRFEWDHKRCNGDVFPVEVLLTSVKLEERSFIHVVWRDITDRKQAEQQREQNRYYLKRAQEIGHIGTWELDLVKNELVWTEENYRIFGIEPGLRLTYEMFLECVHPDDRNYLVDMWNRSVDTNEPYDIEHRILVNGQVKWVREKAELELDYGGRCIRATGFTQDITVRKETEKQQEELVKSLEYKNRELQDIVYTASHDLRSPLVNIEGFSGELGADCDQLLELLTERPEKVDAIKQVKSLLKQDIPECLRFINSGAKKMASLLDGLLQISRIGTVKINREYLDIEKLVREILDAMEHQKKVSNTTVTVESLPGCKADAHMMDHVFTNLISNAIKYRDTAKESKIEISGKVDGDMSIYCVEDNGIGISPHHQKKVFEIFHRLNPEGPVKGEGLGLTIVTRILDRLGGKIWLESQPGIGSKFFIALPCI